MSRADQAQQFYDMAVGGMTLSAIGRMFGISRNAVIGAIDRYRKERGLPSVKAARSGGAIGKAAEYPPAPEIEPAEKPPPKPKRLRGRPSRQSLCSVVPLHKTMAELRRKECAYPYGDGPFTFCGHPIADDCPSYCPDHHALFHTEMRKINVRGIT